MPSAVFFRRVPPVAICRPPNPAPFRCNSFSLSDFYRLSVCKSLFSVIVNASMIKPCGLLSLRVAFINRAVKSHYPVCIVLLFSPQVGNGNIFADIAVHRIAVIQQAGICPVNQGEPFGIGH